MVSGVFAVWDQDLQNKINRYHSPTAKVVSTRADRQLICYELGFGNHFRIACSNLSLNYDRILLNLAVHKECFMLRLAISALLFLISGMLWAEPPAGYPFLSFDQGLAQAQKTNKKLFVYFGRLGCGYCEKVNRETFVDKALRKRYIKNYVLVYVDSESGDRLTLPDGERLSGMELGARLNVFSTPVFLYMEPNGKLILRAPGFKTVKDFVDFDRYVQGGYYHDKSINQFLKDPA
jgi:thioredoxin-related protein